MTHEMNPTNKDDDALSSLLLLLKSNSSRPNVPVSIYDRKNIFLKLLLQIATNAPLLSAGAKPVVDLTDTTIASTPHTQGRNHRINIDVQTLRLHFHLPLAQAAKALGTCTTSLKKICRKHHIERWPCRQITSLTKYLNTLQRACMNINVPPHLRFQYSDEIHKIEKALVDIMEVCF